MKIEESVMEKNFVLEKDDPYGFSLKFMDQASEMGQVFERRNEYMTDGPEHRSALEFDIVSMVDEFSRIQMSVLMRSAQKRLSVNITGSFDVNMEERGFMSSVLSEFYLKNMYPAVRKLSIENLKKLDERIEESMKS